MRRLDRDVRDRAVVRVRGAGVDQAARAQPRPPPGHLDAVELRRLGRRRRQAADPRRPAVGVHDPRGLGRLDADPPVLGVVHDARPGLLALLQLPELLRVLDAAAGAGRELRAADRRLGVRRRRLLPADLVLVPAHDRDPRRHQGVRDQRRRRRRARDRHVHHLPPHRHGPVPPGVPRDPARTSRTTGRRSSSPACCCSSARSRSPRRSRSTPGSPTRWRARRRCPR